MEEAVGEVDVVVWEARAAEGCPCCHTWLQEFDQAKRHGLRQDNCPLLASWNETSTRHMWPSLSTQRNSRLNCWRVAAQVSSL